MRYPKFLEEKGKIGFIAPSFGCNMEPYRSAFENGLKKWASKGYQLHLGPNCYAGVGIGISNTPQSCGKEVVDYYTSVDNDILFSCGGGELMCEILDYVDFDLLKKATPKWFMGYSDNTNITYLLTTLCDTASIYGPCAPAFGMEPWHPSLEDAYGLLTGKIKAVKGYDLWEKEGLKSEEQPLLPYHVTEKRVLKKFPNEEIAIKGRLLGGCMDCLVNLLGTKYDKTKEFVEKYKEDGIIWFLEACDLNVFSIRRAMWQMEHAGWFQYTKGFLIGRPYCMGSEMMGLDQYDAVLEVVKEYQVPVIMDADIGHLAPMMPMVCGAKACVKSIGNEIEIDYDYS